MNDTVHFRLDLDSTYDKMVRALYTHACRSRGKHKNLCLWPKSLRLAIPWAITNAIATRGTDIMFSHHANSGSPHVQVLIILDEDSKIDFRQVGRAEWMVELQVTHDWMRDNPQTAEIIREIIITIITPPPIKLFA